MTVSKIAALSGSLLVAVAVLVGLYLAGSPSEQRLLRFDERRVHDLQSISLSIQAHVDKADRLPDDLSELVDGQLLTKLPLDPVSQEAYVFELTSQNSYRLCAEFSRASDSIPEQDFWFQDGGYQCFNFAPLDEGQ